MAEKLAIEGGEPAKTTPNPPMFPGGLEIGEEEKREVMEVLDRKYLFRIRHLRLLSLCSLSCRLWWKST